MTNPINNELSEIATEELAKYDPEMNTILRVMLEADEDITARAVIRRHSKLSAASTITRNPKRLGLLSAYQARQTEFRGWRGRLAKQSKDRTAMSIADKDARIDELERQVELLTVSHVAMLRAVGEMGGFNRWKSFFEDYKEIRDELAKLNAMPDASIHTLKR